jgi:tRNA(Ile)-lysidine synthase
MQSLLENFSNKINLIFTKENLKQKPQTLAVGLSGGSDSLALTFLLQNFCLKNKIKLVAITINHKLRKGVELELEELKKILKKQKISHKILEINWQQLPKSNVEAKMREARYELLSEFCKKNKINYLFLGHHLGDVAENFLIRLFRGSGLDGLSTMAEIGEFNEIKLIRPLLEISKNELQDFLKAKNIKWFEDETNNDEKFLRNKIRKFLNSFLEEDLIKKRIKAASDEIAKARDLFDCKMSEEARDVVYFKNNKLFLNLAKFKKIEEKFALKILAINTAKIANKAYKPRLERLKIFYNWIINDQNHKSRDFYGCKAKRHDEIFIIIEKK